MYRIEIGAYGGGRRRSGWLGALGRGHWSGDGLGSTFSQIHHPLVAREMQNVVCVQGAGARQRVPLFPAEREGRYKVKT